jgi:hypothetical protein
MKAAGGASLDDDLKRYLDAMMAQLNSKLDQLLDSISAMLADADRFNLGHRPTRR